MIQLSEIRVGNWFNVPRVDQSPFRVDLIEQQSDTYCKVGMNVYFFENPIDRTKLIPGHPLTWENKDLEGIELTTDLLEKLDFKKDVESYTYKDIFRIVKIKDNFFYCNITKDTKVKMLNSSTLHTLQNTFYKCTGTELEINKEILNNALSTELQNKGKRNGEPFEKGDKVYVLTSGVFVKGKVIEVTDQTDYWPVKVKVELENLSMRTFMLDGREYTSSLGPTLFHEEMKIVPMTLK